MGQDGRFRQNGAPFHFSAGTVAAAGSIQADAAALADGFNFVTGADGTKAVRLPAAEEGRVVEIKNDEDAQVLPVFPAVGDQINDAALNAAVNMAADSAATFRALDDSRWFSIPSVPS